MADERQSWRKAFEMIGPETLRLRLEHRRQEYSGEYGREAEIWLLEKDAEKAGVDLRRFKIIRGWTIVAGVAGGIAAIAGLIAAIPVVWNWFR